MQKCSFLSQEISNFANEEPIINPQLHLFFTIMKHTSILLAFLGGAAVGAACGVLFAPEKGSDTRSRIAEAIRKRGLKLSGRELESLVDDIAEELTPLTE